MRDVFHNASNQTFSDYRPRLMTELFPIEAKEQDMRIDLESFTDCGLYTSEQKMHDESIVRSTNLKMSEKFSKGDKKVDKALITYDKQLLLERVPIF